MLPPDSLFCFVTFGLPTGDMPNLRHTHHIRDIGASQKDTCLLLLHGLNFHISRYYVPLSLRHWTLFYLPGNKTKGVSVTHILSNAYSLPSVESVNDYRCLQ